MATHWRAGHDKWLESSRNATGRQGARNVHGGPQHQCTAQLAGTAQNGHGACVQVQARWFWVLESPGIMPHHNRDQHLLPSTTSTVVLGIQYLFEAGCANAPPNCFQGIISTVGERQNFGTVGERRQHRLRQRDRIRFKFSSYDGQRHSGCFCDAFVGRIDGKCSVQCSHRLLGRRRDDGWNKNRHKSPSCDGVRCKGHGPGHCNRSRGEKD